MFFLLYFYHMVKASQTDDCPEHFRIYRFNVMSACVDIFLRVCVIPCVRERMCSCDCLCVGNCE